jgi:integrase
MTYLPSVPGHQIRVFKHVTAEEARRIWREASLEVELFVKILWFTGLRISEVLRLKTTDLKLNGQDYDLVITRSKKRKAQPEMLPIPAELGEVMDKYIRTAKLKAGEKVFSKHENSYRYEIRQCAKRAGLDNWQKIHPHLFRHGCVYRMVQDGQHPYTVSMALGHSSLAVTMQYFTPTPTDIRRALTGRGQ